MSRRSLVTAMTFSILAAAAIGQASAALSPGKVAQLKKAATDIVQIEILDVKVFDSKTTRKNTLIKARVVSVKKTGSRLLPKHVIEIESYQLAIPETDDPVELVKALNDLVGPKGPPTLKKGWTGTVYLKAKKNKTAKKTKTSVKRYGIAAYGHSFEIARPTTIRQKQPTFKKGSSNQTRQ